VNGQKPVDNISQWIEECRKWEAHLNLMADLLVNLHFVGEIEVATAASAAWLWNEGRGGGLCRILGCLGSGECGLHC